MLSASRKRIQRKIWKNERGETSTGWKKRNNKSNRVEKGCQAKPRQASEMLWRWHNGRHRSKRLIPCFGFLFVSKRKSYNNINLLITIQCTKNYIILIDIHYFSEHNFDRRGGRWESLVILYVKGKLKPCDRVLTDKCSVWWCSSHVVTAYFYNNTLHLLAGLKFEATNLYRTLKFYIFSFSKLIFYSSRKW